MLSLMPHGRPPAQDRPGHLIATMFSRGIEPRYCLITDISYGYVQFYLSGFDVPEVFALLFAADGPAMSGNYKVIFRRRQVRRRRQQVCAKFVGAV
jgi:hypothetical protein